MPKNHRGRGPTHAGEPVDSSAAVDSPGEGPEPLDRPAQRGPKAAWVEYAAQLGFERDGLETHSKAEIIELVDEFEDVNDDDDERDDDDDDERDDERDDDDGEGGD